MAIRYDDADDSTQPDAVPMPDLSHDEGEADALDTQEDTQSPTLDEAFLTLSRAVLPLLGDDMVTAEHILETVAIYSNGNHHVGWGRLILVLEGVLGTPLVKR